MTLLAQLSDTHVDDPAHPSDGLRVVDHNERLAMAVSALGAESVTPDAVILTGDLVDEATPGSMQTLADLLAPIDSPVLALPGNHDERELFRDTFDQPYQADDHLGWAVEVGRVTIVGLDTIIPGKPGGRFDDERRQWLAATLDATGDRPTVIAMHHPPFASGITGMDAMGLDGSDAFADTVRDRPNLGLIMCGHLHRPIVATVGGVTTVVGVSTISGVDLDLVPGAQLALIDDPAGYSLHRFNDDRWVTHTRWIHPRAEPIPLDL